MRGLEALRKIGEYIELKANIFREAISTRQIFISEFEIIEDNLKALEIIINKNVDVDYFKAYFDYSDYSDYNDNNKLTEKEFNLLKKVLEDETFEKETSKALGIIHNCVCDNKSYLYIIWFDIVKRELDALNIINIKSVDIEYVKTVSCDEYNEYKLTSDKLTQKEFDLLQKVLSSENGIITFS